MGSTPLTLRYSKCRKYREWRSEHLFYDNVSHKNLVPTGKVKQARRSTSGYRRRIAVQLKHDGETPKTRYCGHVFWSTHPQAVSLARQAGIDLSKFDTSFNVHHEGGT